MCKDEPVISWYAGISLGSTSFHSGYLNDNLLLLWKIISKTEQNESKQARQQQNEGKQARQSKMEANKQGKAEQKDILLLFFSLQTTNILTVLQ